MKRILIREEKILLDADLAMLYGVEPRVLNQAVAGNRKRFPADFMFQLSPREEDALTSQIVISDKDDARGASALRSQIVISKKGRGGRRYRPYAFTERYFACRCVIPRVRMRDRTPPRSTRNSR